MIYIACPYWHTDKNIRDFRRKKSIEYAMELFRRGILCYSPLAYTERYKDNPAKEGYWIDHGIQMVRACNEVHVLCLDGWKDSGGIKGEIAAAKDLGLGIKYITEYNRVSFHGSRSLSDKPTKDLITSCIAEHRPSVIVTHGEPRGVCDLVRKIAKSQGISLMLHHLQKHKYAAGQYHHRSVAVLDDSDFAIFIHDGISDGTLNEYSLAKKKDIPSAYYRRDGQAYVNTLCGKIDQDESVDMSEFSMSLNVD